MKTVHFMDLTTFLSRLARAPETICFADTLALIDTLYVFVPCAFKNGTLDNRAGDNPGACKVLAFAGLHGLSEAQTLACFGEHDRQVQAAPNGSSHPNIRNFRAYGWAGVAFAGCPLTPAP